jgi:hypothetical protein
MGKLAKLAQSLPPNRNQRLVDRMPPKAIAEMKKDLRAIFKKDPPYPSATELTEMIEQVYRVRISRDTARLLILEVRNGKTR